MPDDSLVYYSGLLAQRPRSATALRQILSDYFEIPVEVEQFAGSWYPLEVQDQCQLEARRGINTQLGLGAVVGDEVWYQQSRVRIKLGPLPLKRYPRLSSWRIGPRAAARLYQVLCRPGTGFRSAVNS